MPASNPDPDTDPDPDFCLESQVVQVTGYRLQVTGGRWQVTGCRASASLGDAVFFGT